MEIASKPGAEIDWLGRLARGDAQRGRDVVQVACDDGRSSTGEGIGFAGLVGVANYSDGREQASEDVRGAVADYGAFRFVGTEDVDGFEHTVGVAA
jgi:hypothetical protein